ncbi:MAG: hypothetical protein VR64_02630 [Desulfatitalea sp. BRH_c12]|nr:MAG: hypothetical protein VR64_02630 [Desulfatitalea sp. BRH_c12]
MPEFVLFQSGSSQFALDRKSIRHISLLAADAKKPHNRILRQTIAYQGQTLPLFDLAAALGEDSAAWTPDPKVIIGNLTPAAALRADCVNARLTADVAQVVDLPRVFTGTARACFSKVLLLKERLVLIVDWAGLTVIEPSRTGLPASVQHLPCKNAADLQGPAPTGKTGLSNPESEHTGQRSLEIIVAQKLQQFIEGSVHQMVARTMAETLHRYVGPR